MSEYGAQVPVNSPVGKAIVAALVDAQIHVSDQVRIWRKPALEAGDAVGYTVQIDVEAPVTVELPHGLERGLLRFMAMGIVERMKRQAA